MMSAVYDLTQSPSSTEATEVFSASEDTKFTTHDIKNDDIFEKNGKILEVTQMEKRILTGRKRIPTRGNKILDGGCRVDMNNENEQGIKTIKTYIDSSASNNIYIFDNISPKPYMQSNTKHLRSSMHKNPSPVPTSIPEIIENNIHEKNNKKNIRKKKDLNQDSKKKTFRSLLGNNKKNCTRLQSPKLLRWCRGDPISINDDIGIRGAIVESIGGCIEGLEGGAEDVENDIWTAGGDSRLFERIYGLFNLEDCLQAKAKVEAVLDFFRRSQHDPNTIPTRSQHDLKSDPKKDVNIDVGMNGNMNKKARTVNLSDINIYNDISKENDKNKYSNKIPRVCIIQGPTGCGKNSLVRVCAAIEGLEIFEFDEDEHAAASKDVYITGGDGGQEGETLRDAWIRFLKQTLERSPIPIINKNVNNITSQPSSSRPAKIGRCTGVVLLRHLPYMLINKFPVFVEKMKNVLKRYIYDLHAPKRLLVICMGEGYAQIRALEQLLLDVDDSNPMLLRVKLTPPTPLKILGFLNKILLSEEEREWRRFMAYRGKAGCGSGYRGFLGISEDSLWAIASSCKGDIGQSLAAMQILVVHATSRLRKNVGADGKNIQDNAQIGPNIDIKKYADIKSQTNIKTYTKTKKNTQRNAIIPYSANKNEGMSDERFWMFAKDTNLHTFHCLGKFLYAKRLPCMHSYNNNNIFTSPKGEKGSGVCIYPQLSVHFGVYKHCSMFYEKSERCLKNFESVKYEYTDGDLFLEKGSGFIEKKKTGVCGYQNPIYDIGGGGYGGANSNNGFDCGYGNSGGGSDGGNDGDAVNDGDASGKWAEDVSSDMGDFDVDDLIAVVDCEPHGTDIFVYRGGGMGEFNEYAAIEAKKLIGNNKDDKMTPHACLRDWYTDDWLWVLRARNGYKHSLDVCSNACECMGKTHMSEPIQLPFSALCEKSIRPPLYFDPEDALDLVESNLHTVIQLLHANYLDFFTDIDDCAAAAAAFAASDHSNHSPYTAGGGGAIGSNNITLEQIGTARIAAAVVGRGILDANLNPTKPRTGLGGGCEKKSFGYAYQGSVIAAISKMQRHRSEIWCTYTQTLKKQLSSATECIYTPITSKINWKNTFMHRFVTSQAASRALNGCIFINPYKFSVEVCHNICRCYFHNQQHTHLIDISAVICKGPCMGIVTLSCILFLKHWQDMNTQKKDIFNGNKSRFGQVDETIESWGAPTPGESIPCNSCIGNLDKASADKMIVDGRTYDFESEYDDIDD